MILGDEFRGGIKTDERDGRRDWNLITIFKPIAPPNIVKNSFFLFLIQVDGVGHFKSFFDFSDCGGEDFRRRGAIFPDEEHDQAGKFVGVGEIGLLFKSAEMLQPFLLAKAPAKFQVIGHRPIGSDQMAIK